MSETVTERGSKPLVNGLADPLGSILMGGLLPNLIHDKLDPFLLVEAAHSVGIRAVEVSCRRTDTLELIQKLRPAFPDMAIGVSSLIEDGPYYRFLRKRGPAFPSVDEAVDAGASFLVSVISFSGSTYQRHGHLPIIPGVVSPDQAKRQLDYGASLVKFCNPDLLGGPAYFSTINGGPMHFGLPLLLTGGLRPEKIDHYVKAGMLVAVAGFDLILKGVYEEQQKKADANLIRENLIGYLQSFRDARTRWMPSVDFNSGDANMIQTQSGYFMNT